MKYNIGFPKLCANETLLNEYYKDVSIYLQIVSLYIITLYYLSEFIIVYIF